MASCCWTEYIASTQPVSIEVLPWPQTSSGPERTGTERVWPLAWPQVSPGTSGSVIVNVEPDCAVRKDSGSGPLWKPSPVPCARVTVWSRTFPVLAST